MGVKQGCPFSATLFGVLVDGLERPQTPNHDQTLQNPGD